MKKKISMIVGVSAVLFVATLSTTTACADDSDNAPKTNWAITLGYQGMNASGSGMSYLHNTNPGDAFLPGSGIAGSAGETDISSKFLSFGAIGLRGQQEVVKDVVFNFEFGGLFGDNRDRRQNANDSRPAGNGSFIYSKADYGMYGNVGVAYYATSNFYIGVDAKLSAIFADHGWDRFGSDESAKKETIWAPAICPKVGCYVSASSSVELAAILGRSNGFSLSWVYNF
jgi:hypothetical protein